VYFLQSLFAVHTPSCYICLVVCDNYASCTSLCSHHHHTECYSQFAGTCICFADTGSYVPMPASGYRLVLHFTASWTMSKEFGQVPEFRVWCWSRSAAQFHSVMSHTSSCLWRFLSGLATFPQFMQMTFCRLQPPHPPGLYARGRVKRNSAW